MLAKRIMPCLDVKDSRVVKGTNFVELKNAGDPVELGKKYSDEGADELVFLDITASHENRKTVVEMVRKVAKNVFIPFTVGGGINSLEDIETMLKAGADKVSINTAAVKNPELISAASKRFGSQCIVVAIDAKKVSASKWEVFVKGGREPAKLDAIWWAKKAEKLGAGEILLTSMDADGTKKGYDIELTRKISGAVNIPVIASGGAGNPESMAEVLKKGGADAALAASIFHYGKYSIHEVKDFVRKQGIMVRE